MKSYKETNDFSLEEEKWSVFFILGFEEVDEALYKGTILFFCHDNKNDQYYSYLSIQFWSAGLSP